MNKPLFEQMEDRLLLSGLLPINLEFPQGQYDATGTVAYTAATQAFYSDATPLAFRFSATEARPITAPRDFLLHIKVDSAGNLIGGVAGDDLYIAGQIDRYGDGTIDYDGVLLTGEIAEFGWLDSGGPVDQYNFRFTPTGGDLFTAGFFSGKDIGVTMTSPNSTFTGNWAVNFNGKAQGLFAAIEPLVQIEPGSISGLVFLDANNNGDIDTGEQMLSGVTVTLTGTDDQGAAVSLTTQTDSDGAYSFTDLRPGTYTVTQTQPNDLLDGKDSVGSLGGTLANDVVSNITLASGQDGVGYNFGELEPSSISGFVWEDFNDDGLIDFNEYAIEGTTVTLTGTDDLGNAVSLTTTTDSDGVYAFTGLRPGTYTVTETQPAGYQDGQESLGNVNGSPVGTVGNDVFTQVVLGANEDGVNYNFGERPAQGAAVTAGQTATIGFWQNKNGQALLKNLNGGPNATLLGNWLAATFPKMYGASAGASNLAGMTNAQIAAFYVARFRAKVRGNAGPTKVDCQVMATAFAVYVTNSTLAGTTAAQYGFMVTNDGVGASTWNVGSNGAAFGVANNSVMMVIDLLLATDDRAVNGMLYNMNAALRTMANAVYTAINEAGDIG